MAILCAKDEIDCGSYELLSEDARSKLEAGASITGVIAMDFGQGDFNGIIAQDGEGSPVPAILCDVGGGYRVGARTHPWHPEAACGKPHQLNLTLTPTIIQSHWDGDHYSTAVYVWRHFALNYKTGRNVPEEAGLKKLYKECRWLVRRQRHGPSDTDFVRGVKHMACWPEDLPAHTFQLSPKTYLRVERCEGPNTASSDRNLCGLAVRLIRTQQAHGLLEDHAIKDDEIIADIAEQAILPGDAPYAKFSSLASSSPAKHRRAEISHDDDENSDEGEDNEPEDETEDPKEKEAPVSSASKNAPQATKDKDKQKTSDPTRSAETFNRGATILFAHHHGSHTEFESEHVPEPQKEQKEATPRIVFTFGIKRGGGQCYGHPHQDAVKAYYDRGWQEIYCTAGDLPFMLEKRPPVQDPQRASQIVTFYATDYATEPPTSSLPKRLAKRRKVVALRRKADQ